MCNNDKAEATSIKVWKNKSRFTIVGLYNAPGNKPNLDVVAHMTSEPNNIVIGDFNAPSLRWGYSRTTASGKVVEEFVDENQLEVLDSKPTFLSFSGSTSRPDLAMVHPEIRDRCKLTVLDDPSGCGHRVLLLTVKLKRNLPSNKRVPRWNFKRADWKNYAKESDKRVREELVDDNPDKSNKKVTKAILQTAKKYIPRGQVRKYRPFWTRTLTELKKSRNQARRKAELSHNLQKCVSLRQSQAKLQKEIVSSKRTAYRNFISNIDFRKDARKAHRFISSLNNEGHQIPNEPLIVGRKILTSSLDAAKGLCKHYANVSRLDCKRVERKNLLSRSHPTCLTATDTRLFNDQFALAELELAINEMKCGKSAGPDAIFPEFLKNLGYSAKSTLLKLINLTWNSYLPAEWKKAEIVPLLKNGKSTSDPNSYRPISLTSTCCKLAERMVTNRLMDYLEREKIIDERQAAFRKYRNSSDQVIKFVQAVKDGFNHKMSTVAIMVDFKAAYDKVWKDMLIHKLITYKVSGRLLNWIRLFLSQRLFRVRFRDSTSPYQQQKQGLPQGAVLSCALFNIMINDILDITNKTPGVKALLYADDLIIWATSSNIASIEIELGKTLANLETWANLNKMIVSEQKTTYQIFSLSTKQHRVQLKYKGSELTQQSITKYLGISLDKKLSMAKHIDNISDKASNRNKLLKRLTATKWGATQEVLSTAYKTYVRPLLDYGGELMDLASNLNQSRLDKVQNAALRVITGAAKSTPITAMELQAEIEPLKCRREKALLKFWERSRRVDERYWINYAPASQRLKTQVAPIVRAQELAMKYNITPRNPAPLSNYYDIYTLPPAQLTLNGHDLPKHQSLDVELRVAALDTIHTLYPESKWLHVYTDGSSNPGSGETGAGFYSRFFEGAIAVGAPLSNYDGEVAAVLQAASRVETLPSVSKVVFIIDSQAAIIALSNNTPTECHLTKQCRNRLALLMNKGLQVQLQWVPSHVGLTGNEKADVLAKCGAQLPQPLAQATLQSSKARIVSVVDRCTKEAQQRKAIGKQWECLTTTPLPGNLPRATGVAEFRLLTGHDYLQAHLHRIGITDTDQCPLCGNGRMDKEHLGTCSALRRLNLDTSSYQLANLYWTARRQMAAMPRTGVG